MDDQGHSYHQRLAAQEAEHLARRVFFHDLMHRLRGEPNSVLPFHAVNHLRPKGEHYIGHQVIEVDKIIGSVDRYDDFDSHFMPKEPFTIERWTRLRQAQLAGIEFPPIQVYKVGEAYFVKDGNHRVALAKAEHQVYIDAEVIELDVPVDLSPGDTLKDLIVKGEYARFLELTRLGELRPQHEPILFSRPGRYDILLDHINTRQYFRGLEEKRSFSWEESVCDWYDHLFWPTIEEIRQNRILDGFPGRTEADLYLWIMDHRYYLSTALGHDVGVENATLSYRQQFAQGLKHKLERLWRWITSWRKPAQAQ